MCKRYAEYRDFQSGNEIDCFLLLWWWSMAMMISQILLSRLSAFVFALHHSPFPFHAVNDCVFHSLAFRRWGCNLGIAWMDGWMG